ncbi:MAG: hypothetical protein IPL78_23140 [Chloroflexi bacterium]|nr:hypothetical protein [Chloroflexota bacterium]
MSLVNQVESLDPFSQAGLALALWQLGETAEAQTIVDRLTESAVINGSMVHWQGTTGDGYYDHKTMASDTRSTALVLSALDHIEPGHNLEAGTVLVDGPTAGNGLGTTNETSYAILGLTDHLLAVQAAGNSNPTTYTVELDGTVVEQGILAAAALGTTLELPADLFQPGENILRLSHTGPGLIYYTIVQRTYTAQPAISAAGSVTVSRRYLDPQNHLPVENLQVGIW